MLYDGHADARKPGPRWSIVRLDQGPGERSASFDTMEAMFVDLERRAKLCRGNPAMLGRIALARIGGAA